jgi:6,7-dimethyl-8-ribityllumazine synthase
MIHTQTKRSYNKEITKKFRIAIVRTSYYVELIDNLEEYARKTLIEAGVLSKSIETFVAPGSWEVPLLVQKIAELEQFDAIITFGIIIKGDTYHFEMIANETGRVLMQLSLDYNMPIALGIMGAFTKEQAEVRAGKNDQNKGIEAAHAVLQTLITLRTTISS